MFTRKVGIRDGWKELERRRSVSGLSSLLFESGFSKPGFLTLNCAKENRDSLIPTAVIADIMTQNRLTTSAARMCVGPIGGADLPVLGMGANTNATVTLLFLRYCLCDHWYVESSDVLIDQGRSWWLCDTWYLHGRGSGACWNWWTLFRQNCPWLGARSTLNRQHCSVNIYTNVLESWWWCDLWARTAKTNTKLGTEMRAKKNPKRTNTLALNNQKKSDPNISCLTSHRMLPTNSKIFYMMLRIWPNL